MSECPTEEVLAQLAAGQIEGARQRELLEHIMKCSECRLIASQFERIRVILSCSRIDENGKLVVEMPQLSEEAKSKMNQQVLQEFDRKIAMEDELLALIEEAARIVGPGEAEQPEEPAAIGYYARRPAKEGEEQPLPEDVRDDLHRKLMFLVGILLDPSFPPDDRLSWAEDLLRELKRRLGDAEAAGQS